jgi:hypothetical protein
MIGISVRAIIAQVIGGIGAFVALAPVALWLSPAIRHFVGLAGSPPTSLGLVAAGAVLLVIALRLLQAVLISDPKPRHELRPQSAGAGEQSA